MAASSIAKIGAGTVLAYETDTPGSYVDLENATAIGATGEQGEFVEVTPIASTTKKFISGMKTPPDKEITMNDVPADSEDQDFLLKAKSNETVNMKVTFSNGRVGMFALALSGYVVNEPEGGSAVTITVYGKQSGDTEWSTAA